MEARIGKRLPLPTALDDVSALWLSDVLGKPVHHAKVLDVIAGTSTKIRVGIESDGTLPPTLIVKGGFEEHSPSMAEMYANEVRFYSILAPALPLPGPRCWFAGSDPDSFQSIVILEDLDAARVHWLDPLRPQTPDAVGRRLDSLARFHAASWNDPGFAAGGRFDWLAGRFTDWSMVYANRYLVPEVWRHYCRSPRGAAVSSRLHDHEWMGRAFRDFCQIEANGPRCIVHGDTHLGNLFEWSDGSPGFLDAQPSCAHPVMEVAYHVTAALDIAERGRVERTLLARYLNALRKHGVSAPDFDEAWLRYRQFIAYGFFIFLINQTEFQAEAVNTAYSARFGAAMLEHDVQSLLGCSR